MELEAGRLRAAIDRARAANDTEAVNWLQGKLSELEGGNNSEPSASGVMAALNEGGNRLQRSLGQGIESIGEVTGVDWLDRAGEAFGDRQQRQMDENNYQRNPEYDGFVQNIREGEIGNALGSLGYETLESGPSAVPGAIASFTPQGRLLTLGSTVVQSIGANRQEQEDKGLDEEATWQDIGAGLASGALEMVPGPNGTFIARRATEAAQEVGQEGVVMANTASQGGEYDTQEVIDRSINAAATGAAVSGAVEVGAQGGARVAQGARDQAAQRLSRIRYDEGFDYNDRAAAEALMEASDGNYDLLGDVGSTEANSSARGVANAALQNLRGQFQSRLSELRRYSRARESNPQIEGSINTLENAAQQDITNAVDDEGNIAGLQKQTSNITSRVSQSQIDRILSSFPDVREAQELTDLARQISRIQPFLQANGDLGGLSGDYLRMADPLDGRNNSINKAAALMGAGGAGIGLGPAGIAAGTVLNRGARVYDNLTNKRSKVKRYYDSVMREGPELRTPEGRSVSEIMSEQRAAADQKKIEQKNQQAEGKAFQARSKGYQKWLRDLNQKAQDQARSAMGRESAARDFDPSTDPETFDNPGYREWYKATGLRPAEIEQGIRELEEEGLSPQGNADRFASDINSYSGNKEAYQLQNILRNRKNPGYRPTNGQDPSPRARVSNDPTPPQGNRRQWKSKEGERRRGNLIAQINNSDLPQSVKNGLDGLAATIDSPNMTRADRQAAVDEGLQSIGRNKAERAFWKHEFGPLVNIANDYRIELEQSQDPEAQKEQEFENKTDKIRKEAANSTKAPANLPGAPKAEQALSKLDQSHADQNQMEFDFEAPAPTAEKVEKATTPTPAKPAREARKGSSGLDTMLQDRIQRRNDAEALAEERNVLARYQAELGKSPEDRVESMIYDFANDLVTQNMLTERYASEFGIPMSEAANIVDRALGNLEGQGALKRQVRHGQSGLRKNDKWLKDSEGQQLRVINLEITDPTMRQLLDIAKAVKVADRIVPQDGPRVRYTPDNLQDGAFQAMPDYSPDQVDGSFAPGLQFLDRLRNTRYSYSPKMLSQLEKGMGGASKKKRGVISDVLNPVVGTREVRHRNGKTSTVPMRDDSPLLAYSHIQHQMQDAPNTQFRQEWKMGANGRVYSSNGMAHTQSGDLMKGIARLPERVPVESQDGLDMMFHSFGNALGYDKDSPKSRRDVIFQDGNIDTLLSFAKDPFRDKILSRKKGELTKIGKLVDNSEGFFQALNVANEVADMVSWARERSPKSKLTDAQLLMDPQVQSDIARNYKSDYIVQLDASNNAYQNLGTATGDPALLRATGLQQADPNADPDTTQAADIYVDPAMGAVSRIPALQALDLPRSKIRKLFKGPIGTYLYEASDGTRRDDFESTLQDIAGVGVPVVGAGDRPGLIRVPEDVSKGMQSKEGFAFQVDQYDASGDPKRSFRKRARIVKGDGGYKVERAEGNGKFKPGLQTFKTREAAMENTYKSELLGQMNRELAREMNQRFPVAQEFLQFAQKLSNMLKENGIESAYVPTPDGMRLRSDFKNEAEHDARNVELPDGRVVPMGLPSDRTKLTGRGLAAFMMHQMDAYVLRETHRRMSEAGQMNDGFNPIHDSFGFSPRVAKRGQEVWTEIMQELGQSDYNIFVEVLQANDISVRDFINAGGIIPNRAQVPAQKQSQIPTALS